MCGGGGVETKKSGRKKFRCLFSLSLTRGKTNLLFMFYSFFLNKYFWKNNLLVSLMEKKYQLECFFFSVLQTGKIRFLCLFSCVKRVKEKCREVSSSVKQMKRKEFLLEFPGAFKGRVRKSVFGRSLKYVTSTDSFPNWGSVSRPSLSWCDGCSDRLQPTWRRTRYLHVWPRLGSVCEMTPSRCWSSRCASSSSLEVRVVNNR